jgi:dolichyl-phosphate beta-glucosyltransferase
VLSIIIPCFNEEKIITQSIKKIDDWSRSKDFEIEILIINNASTDNTDEELRKASEIFRISVLNENKKGKGYAIKKGLAEVINSKVLILDADLSTDLNAFDVDWLKKNELLILGSRSLGEEIGTPRIRKFSGYILNLLIRNLFNLNIKDTQCGFKYISSESLKSITEDLSFGGFIYDLDLILLAINRNIDVLEIPVTYTFNNDSSVSLIKDPLVMLRDLFKLRKIYK